MAWTVTLTAKVKKALGKLPANVRDIFVLLQRDLELHGPTRGDWPNYSKLGAQRHHCHLRKGRPTYVAVWEIRKDEIRLIEVTYVGTHENASY
ncbi:type II toxin-antitoxin system RelE family toxin [Desulfolutivibrio sulfoxidireducens]|uniref:type II toxin-antitoxin system RelE family toxin n=1 Tax=Desulfolutivibrio sulfoxidireducens TaxID=2773299 RepID=UPI00159D751F|nr:cytotoxic translational repressor of toxin-antitoxin stability system [Desulfolutivibrio sulfoxidireducens]QLA15372.1 cytotoxic translational repressor of toxin-antitoxin stability system [Desulfolutivibrio sulfoxidireducens]QLA20879.1 cytotoxic translational repressor of toxin-antitoxin stability system [Desulfolutivibrio sulfoxidireducens]